MLTERQLECLSLIVRMSQERGAPPTRREVATAMGMTARAVDDHFYALRRRGFIAWESAKARTIQVLRGYDVSEPARCARCGASYFRGLHDCPLAEQSSPG